MCASPDYLARNGVPESPQALRQHTAVGYIGGRSGRYAAWDFRGADGLFAIEMKETVRVTDTDAYVAAGLAGLGLIRVAGYMVREHLAEGRLVRLLDTAEAPSEPISILYPQSRHLAPAVRAFIDWSSDVIASLSA